MLPVENSQNDISREPAISVIPDVRAFDIQPDESTEVIEFNDMSRLAERTQKTVSGAGVSHPKPARPVASDFHDASTGPQKPDQETWRKGESASSQPHSTTTGNGTADASRQQRSFADGPRPTSGSYSTDEAAVQRSASQVHTKPPTAQANGIHPPLAPAQPPHPPSPGAPRFTRPNNTPYREAPLSALDDTMSRIKGALDVMHSVNDHSDRQSSAPSTVRLPAPSAGSLKPPKWLPPALRPSSSISDQARTDTFDPTHPEPPRSPAPPSTDLMIRLPKISRRIEPLTKRQISYQKYYSPVRWEILSFDPPVEGMTKKSLSVNDVLFRKPQGPFKSRKYRVSLPKSKPVSRQISASGIQRSTSGASSIANTSQDAATPKESSWQSTQAVARVQGTGVSDNAPTTTLDVTSRSPPPELVTKPDSPPTVSGVTSRHRSSSRSVDVTNVAFYRDTRGQKDGNSVIPTVTFTVSSEIESQGSGSPSRKTPVLSADASKSLPGSVSGGSSVEIKAAPLPDLSASATSSSTVTLPPSMAAPTQLESRPVSNANSKGFDHRVQFSLLLFFYFNTTNAHLLRMIPSCRDHQ